MKRGGSGRIDLHYGDSETLVVFQHIHKTAGTSLRSLFSSHYPEIRSVWAPVPDQGHPPPPELGSWYERFWRKRRTEGRLAFVAGHTVNYLLGVVDRPVVAITLVRDPVERVLSRYRFTNRPVPREGKRRGSGR